MALGAVIHRDESVTAQPALLTAETTALDVFEKLNLGTEKCSHKL